MSDEITRILLELIWKLPPELRPGAAAFLGNAAATQAYWSPAIVMLLAVIAFSSLHLYVEAMDG